MLNENHEIHSSSLILIFAASAISQNFSLVPHWRPPKLPKKLEYIFTVLKNHQKCLIWKLLKTQLQVNFLIFWLQNSKLLMFDYLQRKLTEVFIHRWKASRSSSIFFEGIASQE